MMMFRKVERRARTLLRRLVVSAKPEHSGSAREPVPVTVPQPRVVGLPELLAKHGQKYVVFFAPEAGVVPHYIAHCVIAKTLEDLGHKTLIVRCFDVYPRCVVMDSEVLPHDLAPEQRTAVCATCHNYANQMTSEYGLNVVDLRDLADDEVRKNVDALTQNLPEDLSTFVIDGIQFGKICGAEAALTFKATDFTGATPQVRRLLIWYLKGALLSYFAMQRLVDTGSVSRVVHFNEYAILLAAVFAARGRGVPTTYMTMASVQGVDRRRMVLIDDPLAIMSYRSRLKDWERWRQLSLPRTTITELGSDCLFRIAGNSVMIYSPVRTGSTDEVFARLNLEDNRKLLVAFTSSLDEIAANSQFLSALNCEPFSKQQPFRDQIAWLEALVEKVEKSDNLQLVVRVHPREGANRRENVVSNHFGILRSKFTRPFKHVKFVWPGDDVSSYDLMELADAGLSAWSTTALEMARFGVPSVIAFDQHTPLPIGDVVQWSGTPEGYFELIEQNLKCKPTLDTILYAYRWTHLHLLGCAFDFGDIIPTADNGTLPKFKSPRAGKLVEQVLVHGRSALEINRVALLAGQNTKGADDEREALLAQLRRTVWMMCTGVDRIDDYQLCYCEVSVSEVPVGFDAVLSSSGNFIEFTTKDQHVRRRSRMVQRLAELAQSRPTSGPVLS